MKKILLPLLTILVITSAATAQSFPKSATLTKGRSYTVNGSRCNLALTTESTSQMKFSCSGRTTGQRSYGSNSVTLVRRGTFTIKRNGCFLVVRSKNAKKIVVRCAATAPTPTATPTSTPTATATPTPTPTPTLVPNANLLLDTQEVSSFNVATPGNVSAGVALTGVTAGQVIVAVNRRPMNGYLYGLGYDALTGALQLYRISSLTGKAVAVGSTGTFVDGSANPVRVGVDSTTTFSMDFDGISDQLRVITNGGQNFRINPTTGAFIDGNGGVSGLNMDGSINGVPAQVQQIAYTPYSYFNTLYSLDAVSDKLAVQTPNSGAQAEVASFSSQLTSVNGFDIAGGLNNSQRAFAVGTVGTIKSLYQVDLTDGSLIPVDAFASTVPKILSLSVNTPVSPTVVVAGGVSGDGLALLNFSNNVLFNTTLSGIDAGEVIVGADYRTTTGVLFALGINSSAETGTLYSIDPYRSTATAIGGVGSVAFVDTLGAAVDLPTVVTGYGVDFNPVTDTLHIVTGNGLNFRVNPTTGAGVDGNSGVSGTQMDPGLSGVATSLVGIGFTNSYPGATATTLYGINSVTNSIVVLNPTTGVTSNELLIVAGGFLANFGNRSSLDIQSSVSTSTTNSPVTSGKAHANLDGYLYEVDLTTGVATGVGSPGIAEGFAIGSFDLD